MAILGRRTLYSIFVNGAIPTEKDFQNLIDSSLNRKDDNFFGKWRPGVTYCDGDVVLHKKSLYKLVLPNASDCPQDDEAGEMPDNSGDQDATGGCICSNDPPDVDTNNWCLLELEVGDDDWIVLDNDLGVARVVGRVAIGHESPQAALDLSDQTNGQLWLEPNQDGSPAITMLRLNPPENDGDPPETTASVDYRLEEERVCWDTDTLGYVFKVMGEEVGVFSRSVGPEAPSTSDDAPEVLLMLVGRDPQNRAEVGIGTDAPRATLDVHANGNSQLLFAPKDHEQAEIMLINLANAGNEQYFLTQVTDNFTAFSTDAPGGFLFTDGIDYNDVMQPGSPKVGEAVLSINTTDKTVGVGTSKASSNFEVFGGSGTIRNHIHSGGNPVLSINNLQPDPQAPNTYLTLGVDDTYGTIVSDAPKGLVVKRGGKHGEFDHEVNINQGTKIFYIDAEGKTGIRTSEGPKFDLDVNGKIRSLGLYVDTNDEKITQSADLGPVLPTICNKLKPIVFTYKEGTNRAGEKGIGFYAQNVFESVNELALVTGDTKSVDYGGMTAFLVKAIQEQQEIIRGLKKRIEALEDKSGKSMK